MKILTLDIETRPSLAYVWSIWDQNISIDQLSEMRSGDVLCWAAKWHDSSKVEFKSVYHDGKKNMIKGIWTLLDQADVVVHFNGKTFDVPHLNAEFLSAGLPPPAPFSQVDLKVIVSKDFRMLSHKLDYISQALGIGNKIKHEGFSLWLKCMDNDAGAWKRMKTYNIGDVTLTEKLYDRLLPWIKSHPSYGARTGLNVCPNCGSDKLMSRGYAHTRTSKYQRYQCKQCGKWSRSTHRLEHTEIVTVTPQ